MRGTYYAIRPKAAGRGSVAAGRSGLPCAGSVSARSNTSASSLVRQLHRLVPASGHLLGVGFLAVTESSGRLRFDIFAFSHDVQDGMGTLINKASEQLLRVPRKRSPKRKSVRMCPG